MQPHEKKKHCQKRKLANNNKNRRKNESKKRHYHKTDECGVNNTGENTTYQNTKSDVKGK